MENLSPEQVTLIELAAELYPHVSPGEGETRAGVAVTEALNIARDVMERTQEKTG